MLCVRLDEYSLAPNGDKTCHFCDMPAVWLVQNMAREDYRDPPAYLECSYCKSMDQGYYARKHRNKENSMLVSRTVYFPEYGSFYWLESDPKYGLTLCHCEANSYRQGDFSNAGEVEDPDAGGDGEAFLAKINKVFDTDYCLGYYGLTTVGAVLSRLIMGAY